MAYASAKILDARGNVVRVAHPDLPQFPSTVALASSAGATAQTVGDNEGFADDNYIVLGPLGQDKTEIIRIDAAVTRGTSLTTTATVFDHPLDSPVKLILWNQIEISGASSVSGSKTVITTVDIDSAMPDTEYVVSGTTYSYYFARYKNSTSTTYSAYSDAAPATGYSADTVRAVKESALSMVGERVDEGVITNDFLNNEITNCEIDIWKEKRRWAQFDVNDYVLGTLDAGVVAFDMPTDISDPDTDEAIRSVRVRQVGQLRKVGREEFDGLRWDTAVDSLLTQADAGDTSVAMNSVADFEDSGSVFIGEDSVTYTSRDTTLNTLSGIPASGTGAITETHDAGVAVWQGGFVDMAPVVWTPMDGQVNLVLPASATFWGQAIYLSYYAKPTYPDSDADIVEWPDPELYHYYLAWKITLRRHDGVPTEASIQFKALYDERKKLLLSRARLQDYPKFTPRVPYKRQSMAPFSDGDPMVSWIIR